MPHRQVRAVNRPIYLDYSATTPVDARVAKKMIPFLSEHFGNPASRSHRYGWEAEEAVEGARQQVARLVGADPKEIVWTSGATESNNLAIAGAARFHRAKVLRSATCRRRRTVCSISNASPTRSVRIRCSPPSCTSTMKSA